MNFSRIVIKLSGEALAGEKRFSLDDDVVLRIAKSICKVHATTTDIAIVVGGGNFWRGRTAVDIDPASSDYMGMLGTVINALRLQASLESLGVDTRVQTAIDMDKVAEPYIRRRAMRHMEKGRIVIFAAGTGNPYFTTDTTAALRAAEINADIILLGKKGVDAVYDKDPNRFSDAKAFTALSYMDVLQRGLGIMDATATSLCMDNQIPLRVFGIDDPDNLIRAAAGENIGTLVGGTEYV